MARIEKIFAVQGIVKVKVVAETWCQSWIALLVIVLIEEKPKWVEVVVLGPIHISTIIKGKAMLVRR